MTPDEVQELLDAKEWTRTRLAYELNISENAVTQWLSGRRKPGGPAAILMRMWLAQARPHVEVAPKVETKAHKSNGRRKAAAR